jgi:hypothetical protein
VRLSVVSVFSFSCKALLVFLKVLGILQDGSSLYLSTSTLMVEAFPSLVTIILLMRYHGRSLMAARGVLVGMDTNLLASVASDR